MFLPLNETELSEGGSFLDGLLEVFGVRHRTPNNYILTLQHFDLYFSNIVMKIQFRETKTFGLGFVSQVRS